MSQLAPRHLSQLLDRFGAAHIAEKGTRHRPLRFKFRAHRFGPIELHVSDHDTASTGIGERQCNSSTDSATCACHNTSLLPDFHASPPWLSAA